MESAGLRSARDYGALMQTIDDVISGIENGKIQEYLHQNIELKAAWSQEYGQKISALANRPGGSLSWVIVGLNDNGTLSGKDNLWAKKTEEVISQQINDKLDPIQACDGIFAKEIKGSFIIVIRVKNPGDVVYWGEKAYCASGTTQKQMEPSQVLALRLQLPGLTDFTRQPTESNCDLDLVSHLHERIKSRGSLLENTHDSSSLMQSLGLANTQAARILFGDYAYRVVEFDSHDKPLTQKGEHGLYRILTEEFQEFVQKRTASLAKKDFRPYPDLALHEALANAVAHAAYFEQGGDVIIELRPTSLTISNLCLRESQFFANRWFSRAHKTVNAYLMEVLRVAGHVDELGRGKNVIFAESIKNGKQPPLVDIQPAGKYFRWSITLNGDVSNRRYLNVFRRVSEIYKDQRQALIAQALVLWRDKPVSEIKNYIDESFAGVFADLLSSFEGPIFYWKEKDRIVLRRWARLMLEEGKDSKQLSLEEEMRFLEFARDYCIKFKAGHITPSVVRDLGDFSDSLSARTLSSQLLTKWRREGHVKKLSHGKYQFVNKPHVVTEELRDQLLKILGGTVAPSSATNTNGEGSS